jgi:hypothetical protein
VDARGARESTLASADVSLTRPREVRASWGELEVARLGAIMRAAELTEGARVGRAAAWDWVTSPGTALGQSTLRNIDSCDGRDSSGGTTWSQVLVVGVTGWEGARFGVVGRVLGGAGAVVDPLSVMDKLHWRLLETFLSDVLHKLPLVLIAAEPVLVSCQ